MEKMDRIPVESSNLRSIGYDAASQTFEVEFKSHAIYQYYNVPEQIWMELEAAPSKGKYYSSQIKDRFLSQRVS